MSNLPSNVIKLAKFRKEPVSLDRNVYEMLKFIVRVNKNPYYAYFIAMVHPRDVDITLSLKSSIDEISKKTPYFKSVVLADCMIYPVEHKLKIAGYDEAIEFFREDETLAILEVHQDFELPQIEIGRSELILQADCFYWRVERPTVESVYIPWDFFEQFPEGHLE